jgi:hypothetical protein
MSISRTGFYLMRNSYPFLSATNSLSAAGSSFNPSINPLLSSTRNMSSLMDLNQTYQGNGTQIMFNPTQSRPFLFEPSVWGKQETILGNFGSRNIATTTEDTISSNSQTATNAPTQMDAMFNWLKSWYDNTGQKILMGSQLLEVAEKSGALRENEPIFRIHSSIPDNGLEQRGDFQHINFPDIARYIAYNSHRDVYGACSNWDDLRDGYLKEKDLENGDTGLIIGIPERSIAALGVAADIMLFKDDDMMKLQENLYKEKEVFFEVLEKHQVPFYITDLKDFNEGKDVENKLATDENGLPKTINKQQAQNPVYIKQVTEQYADFLQRQQPELKSSTTSVMSSESTSEMESKETNKKTTSSFREIMQQARKEQTLEEGQSHNLSLN